MSESLKEVLEAFDLESMKLLLEKVRNGEISAAELAAGQQALKRHGVAIVDTDSGKRRELEEALASRRAKRRAAIPAATLDEFDIDNFQERLQ